MNRLTEKISNEILVKNKNGNGSRSICYGCDGISNCTTRVCNFYRAMEKLAAYEDTGFEPEEVYKTIKAGVPEWIPKYLEYRKLEEQGLLIKLPCKVGDTVYKIYNTQGCNNCINKWSSCDGISCPPPKVIESKFGYDDLGELQDIFITRVEAEKALEAGD